MSFRDPQVFAWSLDEIVPSARLKVCARIFVLGATLHLDQYVRIDALWLIVEFFLGSGLSRTAQQRT